jgi:hypothetical protein
VPINIIPGTSTGCVYPNFPDWITYSTAQTPNLVSHVRQAQGSGLRGGRESEPLRKTDSGTAEKNRAMACGKAPSIEGLSCDEYPPAIAAEGLTSGGNHRTFDGCQMNYPRETGPIGVSVCMIPVGENSSQGGTHSGFVKNRRVLAGDPFRVVPLD